MANISADITKEQLEEWQDQKLTYKEMAEAAGVGTSTIANYLRKYNMVRDRNTPPEDRQRFRELLKAGKKTREIASITGYAYSTVYLALKEEGLIPDRFKTEENVENTSTEDTFTPRVLRYAVKRRPKIFKVTYGISHYIDITDTYIPW